MEYVIPAVIVVLLVGGFVAFMTMRSTKKSGPAATGDTGKPGIGRDESPLGDTTEHAGTQDEGATVDDPESKPPPTPDPDAAAHVARPGEGEGRKELDFEGRRPASERLSDREP